MTPEEIKAFKAAVADPVMENLMKRTVLSNGLRFVDRLDISYLDGRSCGTDSVFKASGLSYQDGTVKPFEHEVFDTDFAEFLNSLKDCTFILDGTAFIFDELNEMEILTKIRTLSCCAVLFADLAQMRDVTYSFENPEYLKMRFILQNSGPEKAELDSLLDSATSRAAVNQHSSGATTRDPERFELFKR